MKFDGRIALLALCLFSSHSFLPEPLMASWEPIGPYGGVVRTIAMAPGDPSVMYAGTQNALGDPVVFRSDDGGATWSPASDGLPGVTVNAIAVDAVNSDRLFAATTHGLHRSLDGGQTWAVVVANDNSSEANAVTIDPTNPQRVYAGFSGLPLQRSSDGGDTWEEAADGIFNDLCNDIVIDRDNSDVLYSAHYTAVYRSTNGADSWPPVTPGGALNEVYDIVQATDGTIYAVRDSGVLRSLDRGDTWQERGSFRTGPGAAGTLEVDPANRDTLFGASESDGLFRSADGGITWQSVQNSIEIDRTFVVRIRADGNRLFSGTHQGLFASTDEGDTWSPADHGILSQEVFNMAVDPTDPARLFASTRNGGIFRSLDGGANWTAVNNGLYPSARSVAIDPSAPERVLVGTAVFGIHLSTNGGDSWIQVTQAGIANTTLTLEFDPEDPSIVYGGTLGTPVLLKSVDGGESWLEANTGLGNMVSDLAFDAAGSSTLYAISDVGTVYRSTDAAATWQLTNSGTASNLLQSLVVDPFQPNLVLAGNQFQNGLTDSVFRSTDGGDTWQTAKAGLDQREIDALAADPSRPGTFLAGATNNTLISGGIFQSRDYGDTWSQIGPGNLNVLSFEVTPQATYATTRSGIYRYSTLMFADGFESGNLTAWSSVTP